MVTVAHIVKRELRKLPFIEEGLSRDIISVGNLAEELLPAVEEEFGHKVKLPAVIMAIRRHASGIKEKEPGHGLPSGSNLSIKSGIADISVSRSPHLLAKLDRLFGIVDYERGEIMNIIQGSYEASIITNQRHEKNIIKVLQKENVLSVEKNLGALSIMFGKEFLYTPGVIYAAVKELAWNNINIYELISTNTELTFILSSKDIIRAYKLLERFT